MKLPAFLLAGLLLPAPVWGHPHEWVDWGVGLVIDEKKPKTLVSIQLEMTWDEWFSSLMMTDFPGIAKGTLSAADLKQLDATYLIGSSQRATSLTVWYRGAPVAVKPAIQAPRTNGKTVTVVYSLPLAIKITAPSELKISLYDPTYYTDMGIRAKSGVFFKGVKDPASYEGSYSFVQDFDHPYYQGTVFPEVVVLALKP